MQSATFSFTYVEILAVPTISLINNSGQLSTGAEPVLVGKRDFKKYNAVFYHRSLLFRPSPLYRFLILGRSDLKKTESWEKKIARTLRNRRPWYPRMTLKVNIHIFGLTTCTIYCKNVPVFLFLFFSMMLLCSFFRLKELFQVKNGLTTSLLVVFFFFSENAKYLGRSDDAKRRKRPGGP